MAKSAKSAASDGKHAAKPAAAEFPLLGHVDGLIDGLRKNIPAALREFDEDAVHDARVATRRLKAAMDLLDPVLARGRWKPFAYELKCLRRRLGPMRDLDVMLGHLDEFAKIPRHAAASRWLADRLSDERRKVRDKAASKKSASNKTLSRLGAWWGLREEVVDAKEAVGPLLAESLHLQLDAFAEQADQIACRSGADKAGPVAAAAAEAAAGDVSPGSAADLSRIVVTPEDVDPESAAAPTPDPSAAADAPHVDPHELRIAGKALRYTLEMAVVEGHKLPPGVSKSFKSMQEALGLWHDYVVLTETAMRTSLDVELPLHDASLSADVLDLARAVLQRSAKELQRFSTMWLDRGEELARAIRSAFPLTRSLQTPAEEKADAAGEFVTAPQTGPGPCGSGGPAVPAEAAPGETSAA